MIQLLLLGILIAILLSSEQGRDVLAWSGMAARRLLKWSAILAVVAVAIGLAIWIGSDSQIMLLLVGVWAFLIYRERKRGPIQFGKPTE